MMRALNSRSKTYEFKTLSTALNLEATAIAWNPDLIILDLYLPEYNGIEILRDLVGRHGSVVFPIVIATGTGSETLAVEAMKLGALDYVVKDGLTALRLEEVVTRAIQKSFLQKKILEQTKLLKLHQKRLTLAMESANMGAWEWDTVTNLIYWDSQTAKVMGITETQVARPINEFLANVQEKYRSEIFKLSALPEVYREYDYVFPVEQNGQTVRWVKNFGKADDSNLQDGKAVLFYGTCLDVTDQHLYKELQAAHLLSSRTDVLGLHVERELREQFVSTLSHDLRNPLAAAKMGTELILRSEGGKAIGKQLGRILLNLNRVDHMIQDLLDANRIGAGQAVPLNVSACDLEEAISECLEGLRLDFGERFSFNQAQKIEGYWDKFGIQRVFENLLTNAVKYGLPDSLITVSVIKSDLGVKILFHNLSQGLSITDQEKIFKPFHRTSTADNSNVRGWGLGLTIVRGITESHGGHVSVESVLGESVTFVVELPLDCRNMLKK